LRPDRSRKDAFKGLELLDGKLANALIEVADTVLGGAATELLLRSGTDGFPSRPDRWVAHVATVGLAYFAAPS
jgi:hypothetical protein